MAYTPEISLLHVKIGEIIVYFIDTDEIPGFFLLLKNHTFIARSEDTIFSLTFEDIGVAMVANMIDHLQESFPLRRAAGSFEISLTKWLRGTKTLQLPVTLSMSCQIFTSILFPSMFNIQEDLPKSQKVTLKNSLRGKKMQTLKKKTFYDLKGVKKFLVEERHKIREIEKIPPTESDSYLSQFVLAARTGKDYEPSLSAELWLVLKAVGVAAVTAKLSSKTVISKKQETR